ncbi:MAG: 50S ribosomal protein L23 [bacterium]|nr:50S ribosomal protein L23 [bacterium]
MKLIPIYTEKSTKLAKDGKYTFMVDLNSTKMSLKKAILDVFGLHVTEVRTIKTYVEHKRNAKGHKMSVNAVKKAIIMIKDGEKMDLFEEKKK